MKHINPFDRIVQQKLVDYEEETPMHLWAAIDKERTFAHKAKNQLKRRWLLLLLLLLGGTGMWLGYEQLNNAAESPTTAPLPLSELSPVAMNDQIKDISNEIPEVKSTELVELKEKAELETVTNISTSEEKAKQNTKKVVKKTAIGSSKVTPAKKDKQAFKTIASLPENSHLSSIDAPDDLTLEKSNFVDTETDDTVIASKNTSAKKKSHKIWFLTSKTKLLKRPPVVLPNPATCYSFRGHPLDIRAIYFDALVTPEYARRTLSTEDRTMLNYRNLRNQTENYAWAGSVGLRMSVVGNSGMAYRVGLNYSQITENFDYTTQTEERITIINRYDEQGNFIGTDTTIEMGTQHIQHCNRYKMVDIPLIFGYEIEAAKFALTLNAGAYVNIVFQQEGEFIAPDFQVVDFNSAFDDNATYFRKQLDLSWFASVGFNYKLSNRLQWVVEPQIRYFPTSFTHNEFPIQQNYLNFGLSTGLRVRL